MLQRLDAMSDGSRPRVPLQMMMAMHLDAGAERRDALTTWISQATNEEIVGDIQSMLHKLREGRSSRK